MKASNSALVIAIIGFGLTLGLAQANCPVAAYANLFPFPQNADVKFWFDEAGSIGDSTNPAPKFILTTNIASTWAAGMAAWNGHANQNGTGITFTQSTQTAASNGPVWIVSTEWPRANVSYRDSAGVIRTYPIDFSQVSPSVVAMTSGLPDFDANGVMLGTAGAYVHINQHERVVHRWASKLPGI